MCPSAARLKQETSLRLESNRLEAVDNGFCGARVVTTAAIGYRIGGFHCYHKFSDLLELTKSKMAIRAYVDNKFIRRFLYISIGCFLFMLWGLYDGLVTKPSELKRSLKYLELIEKRDKDEITEDQRSEMWQKAANENNWAISQPDKPKDVQNDVYFQWFVFGVGLLLGIFFLLKYLRLLNSWMEADDAGVTTSWGESLQFKQIKSIDKRKWAIKGIAKVNYADHAGAERVMVFDDFKYQRESMGEIMMLAEAGLSDEQITGGQRQLKAGSSQDLLLDDD